MNRITPVRDAEGQAEGLGPVALYFSLFEGDGGDATFLASSHGQQPLTDFDVLLDLEIGDYTFALSGWGNRYADKANKSRAETVSDGSNRTLKLGFAGDLEMFSSDSPKFNYKVNVTTPNSTGGTVPEPATGALALVALAAAALASGRRRTRTAFAASGGVRRRAATGPGPTRRQV